MARQPAPFPSREQILDFVQNSPGEVGKREIARAFQLDAEQKRLLKKVLREMALEGELRRGRGKRFGYATSLPEVLLVQISRVDDDDRLYATPMNWELDDAPPKIIVSSDRHIKPALGIGDRVLVRVAATGSGYKAKAIRRVEARPVEVLGVFDQIGDGEGRIRPTSRRERSEFTVQARDTAGAQSGDLVRAEILPGKHLGLRRARIVERLEGMEDPQAFSLIAIHQNEIPYVFPPEALAEAERAGPAPLGNRTDLRQLPLVTIDGSDARDFDDAVWAEADTAPDNPGGWRCVVAIADVAWYTRPGSPLDIEAKKRGNSVYFPDRVVPMLPEALSNGWCSLKPDEDRPCMVARFRIDAAGNLIDHRFERALMRSVARLTYEQIQRARDGEPDDVTGPLMDKVVVPLYGAYASLEQARQARNTLELELSERQVVIDGDGKVVAIRERERLDSHKLIEEFMITANVAAAETLERRRAPCMYRIHDQPSAEKIEALSQFLDSLDLRFAKGQVVKPIQFNQILARVADTPLQHMVNEVVLRSQAQAEYSPENIGHFGLALRRYCHFTSPIRRYSDLVVHRALIHALSLGPGGDVLDGDTMVMLGSQLSQAERRAAVAEREAVDRYTAQYLTAQVGAVFRARVNGVTRAGLFVTLDDTGADGLVPIRSLPDDYYVHDETLHRLKGRESGRTYRLGQALDVMLMEAVPITGGMIFQVLDGGPAPKPQRKTGRGGGKSRAGRRRARHQRR